MVGLNYLAFQSSDF